MSISQTFIQELEQEAETTRRVLERVPGDRLAWKPHAKSMSLGQLALHVASTPGAIAQMAAQSSVSVPEFNQPEAKTTTEILSSLDETVATAKSVLEGFDDAAMGETWRVMAGDQDRCRRSTDRARTKTRSRAERGPAFNYVPQKVSRTISSGRGGVSRSA